MPAPDHIDPAEMLSALVDFIAGAVAERQHDEIREAIADALADSLPRTTASAGGEIYGVNPHKLYPIKFVADLFSYEEDYVRTISKGEEAPLKRVPWQGGSIRFRGVDILRYMGVPEEELASRNVVSLPRPTLRF